MNKKNKYIVRAINAGKKEVFISAADDIIRSLLKEFCVRDIKRMWWLVVEEE